MKKALINWNGTETILTWQGMTIHDARDLDGNLVSIGIPQQVEAIKQAQKVLQKGAIG